MNYLKYYQNQKYQLGKYDCWTFIQEVFKNEQNILLPDVPIFNDTNEGYLKENIKHKVLKKAENGCLVFVKTKFLNHVGYAVSDNEYIHKTGNTGVIISKIPQNAEYFKIIRDN